MKTCAIASLAFVLVACAAPEASREKEFTQAATAPLSDLNLVNAEIPAALAAARKGPYAPPIDATCAGLAAEVTTLDSLLGPDLDTQVSPSNPGLVERGVEALGNAAIGAVRGSAERIVPYRSWVRKLSGAERYSKEVAAAIAAGTIRRSFLKGLGHAGGCQAPAAPRR
jgi:hypothetical protein